jgi:hypothetical protein
MTLMRLCVDPNEALKTQDIDSVGVNLKGSNIISISSSVGSEAGGNGPVYQ